MYFGLAELFHESADDNAMKEILNEFLNRFSSDNRLSFIMTKAKIILDGQSNWRMCGKCKGLVFVGGSSLGACPAQGEHDQRGSLDYILVHKR
jgi:hypothetical protein